jgi:hypothetical protein
MAVEPQNENNPSQQKEPSLLGRIFGKNYLGGELKAAFFQGIQELGTAFSKPFPDSIQVDYAGTNFNPLYRDRDGVEPAHASPSSIADQGASRGSVHGDKDSKSMSPSAIADESASRGSVHGGSPANSQSPSDIADNPQQESMEQTQSRHRGRGM